ncbi:hypothetical protein RRG08_067080 [Elysia crispata]|uniref:Cyclic nucleotide-binding domain-containing protein n=1 Tax=Elysia crispata TaxID=231223 RepID=A0AAE1B7Y6_9GAST|nr:hypothetical protein RRG08_067080 [Elysia crispata]
MISLSNTGGKTCKAWHLLHLGRGTSRFSLITKEAQATHTHTHTNRAHTITQTSKQFSSSGKYDIFVNTDSKNRKLVGNYNNEGFFGELALMYNMPRAATIVAATDGIVWGLGLVGSVQVHGISALTSSAHDAASVEEFVNNYDVLYV